MSNSTVVTKNTGDQLAASEVNNIVGAVNSKKGYQEVASKAALFTAISNNATEVRDILVLTDESEDNHTTMYLYTGSQTVLIKTF